MTPLHGRHYRYARPLITTLFNYHMTVLLTRLLSAFVSVGLSVLVQRDMAIAPIVRFLTISSL